VALAVEEDVALDPGDVGLFGTVAIVARAQGCADAVEEARLGRIRRAGLADGEETNSRVSDHLATPFRGNNILDSPAAARLGYRLVTFWQIMEQFRAEKFFSLASIMGKYGRTPKPGDWTNEPTTQATTVRIFREVHEACTAAALPVSAGIALGHFQRATRKIPTLTEFQSAFQSLRDSIHTELSSRIFLQVPVERLPLVTMPYPFGEEVANRFPIIRDEIRSAAHCLAFGTGTASVFHLMRVVEVALNAVTHYLTGQEEYFPSWNAAFQRIDSELKKLALNKKDAAARRKERFVSEIRLHLEAVKNGWRNPTIHDIARLYTEEQALVIFNAVRTLMQHLATEIGE
jgi:hypothetical protein